ncbi:hypothetical protein J6590_007220 [Homalodisca vitripennis]|nr:hypothetical protein J6590_007220 [Homalodisca vitripennis]
MGYSTAPHCLAACVIYVLSLMCQGRDVARAIDSQQTPDNNIQVLAPQEDLLCLCLYLPLAPANSQTVLVTNQLPANNFQSNQLLFIRITYNQKPPHNIPK